MLWTLAIILLILWALGFFAFSWGGGLIHLLLVIALIVIVYELVTGRRHVV
ncbi:MAG TPA: lmo0937 family membrane protein [Gemmatimonadaceae bacterium]|nr:lmo0937 family membrane protein [Gemmatimonadaceae bacterium]